MAQVLGKSGRYVSRQAGSLRRQISLRIILAVGFLCLLQGLILSHYLPVGQLAPLPFVLFAVAVLAFAWGLDRYLKRNLRTLEQQQRNHERGLTGESHVAQILAHLPDDFHVLNDLTTRSGNLDHVVIGPTGVFILDAKNWRGQVTADGRGELLLNGRATDKPAIRPFVSRLMSVRDTIRALTPKLDPYYRGVFVFTAARVEARWGTTGKVHCVTDDQLRDYITRKNFGAQLDRDQVRQLAQAFQTLAHHDPEFASQSGGPQPPAAPQPYPLHHPRATIQLARPAPARA